MNNATGLTSNKWVGTDLASLQGRKKLSKKLNLLTGEDAK
jgi:hypothetical protein